MNIDSWVAAILFVGGSCYVVYGIVRWIIGNHHD